MNNAEGNLSYATMQVFRNIPEGTLIELIDNILYPAVSRNVEHQRVLKKIAVELMTLIEDTERGLVIFQPLDVYLDEISNCVQPDLFVVLKDNPNQIDRYFHGVPDLVMEILSPGHEHYDCIIKKSVYERFGVKEYWIINPHSLEIIGHSLQNGSLVVTSQHKGKIVSQLLNVTVTL